MSIIRSFATVPLSRASYRALSTTAIYRKSLTDSVKETAENINKNVGQTLAGGIDSTEKMTKAAKEAINSKTPSQGEMKAAADDLGSSATETAESARQNANQKLGQAAGAARDMKEDVKKNF
ncbi:uncharacterized protein L203_102965 [Cryptococcus depauperatus CBS 7841]|uniref:Uncharacterized protein n=1 Tax=Cryptococcus depauperatus CBS 7841 TaxID=1295531 RepID=A0A1E3IPX7_9TREE|nr:hypothetical protein L203_01768 [Cryptococcus depauperatus CBS 7841]